MGQTGLPSTIPSLKEKRNIANHIEDFTCYRIMKHRNPAANAPNSDFNEAFREYEKPDLISN